MRALYLIKNRAIYRKHGANVGISCDLTKEKGEKMTPDTCFKQNFAGLRVKNLHFFESFSKTILTFAPT